MWTLFFVLEKVFPEPCSVQTNDSTHVPDVSFHSQTPEAPSHSSSLSSHKLLPLTAPPSHKLLPLTAPPSTASPSHSSSLSHGEAASSRNRTEGGRPDLSRGGDVSEHIRGQRRRGREGREEKMEGVEGEKMEGRGQPACAVTLQPITSDRNQDPVRGEQAGSDCYDVSLSMSGSHLLLDFFDQQGG